MKKRLKMSTAAEIKRAVTRVANMVLNDELEPGKAKAIIYAANTNLSSIRVDEQEKRLEELESIVEEIQRR